MSFTFNIDTTQIELQLQSSQQNQSSVDIVYNSDLPTFLDTFYVNVMTYLKLDPTKFNKEFHLKKGDFKNPMFTPKNESSFRIVFNLGDVQNFRLTKAVNGNQRQFEEFCLEKNWAQIVNKSHTDYDIVVNTSHRQKVYFREKRINGKGKPYYHLRESIKLRPSTYVSKFLILSVWDIVEMPKISQPIDIPMEGPSSFEYKDEFNTQEDYSDSKIVRI